MEWHESRRGVGQYVEVGGGRGAHGHGSAFGVHLVINQPPLLQKGVNPERGTRAKTGEKKKDKTTYGGASLARVTSDRLGRIQTGSGVGGALIDPPRANDGPGLLHLGHFQIGWTSGFFFGRSSNQYGRFGESRESMSARMDGL